MAGNTAQRLDEFMRESLSRYYNDRDPLGANGDFTTAPEVSQLFGEIIGVWTMQQWQAMGAPSAFNLIELGPGRGTLMADLLRGAHNYDDFIDSANIILIETSKTLTQIQKEKLSDYDVSWARHLKDVDNTLPSIIIANEFFDALPIRQFQLRNGQWHEAFIIENGTKWEIANDISQPLKATLDDANEGDIFEYSKDQEDYAQLMNEFHGAFLIIDYGYFKSSYGDSLQALHKHEPCEITDHVGEADLTTHIDFEWLASMFKGSHIKFKTQANFLRENGIDIRLHILGQQKMKSGYDRLMGPTQMGELFKVMEVTKFPVQSY
jgi:NADH dehydrogenase [ubiquinone] 1 alpha subcomplex assembly factor 7